MTYQRVREKQVSIFKQSYEPSSVDSIDQAELPKLDDSNFVIPMLPELWDHLKANPLLGDTVLVGQGLIHKGENDPTLPKSAIRVSDKPFERGKEGYVGWEKTQMTHLLPETKWLNLDKPTIRRPMSGTATGCPQVLLNYARVSRVEWRLKALLDQKGYPVTTRFLVVRPGSNDVSILALWGILNSPVANAYAFSVSSKRDVEAGQMRDLPIPSKIDDWDQTSALKTELIEKKIRKEASETDLKELAHLKMLTEARGEFFAPLPPPRAGRLLDLPPLSPLVKGRVLFPLCILPEAGNLGLSRQRFRTRSRRCAEHRTRTLPRIHKPRLRLPQLQQTQK